MEIKDIAVSAERLEEVRGGQRIDIDQFALQIGGNTGISGASSFGVGNNTASGVWQNNPQSLTQSANVNAAEYDVHETKIENSLVGFPFFPL